MSRRALVLLVLSSLVPACSAVVSPNLGRLGGTDAGSLVDLDGAAACASGLVLCAGRCVDVSSDPSACGRCGNACGTGASCVSGTCVCPAGAPGCAPVTGIGDPADCGASHARCLGGQLCVAGACECRPALTLVGGACVDLSSDPDHCGTPSHRCADVCQAGTCRGGCGDGLRECDDACVDLSRDPLNCGECGHACSGRSACVDGDCRDVRPATGCDACPCAACDGLRCCTLPRLSVPYCIEAGACPP